MKLLQTPGLGFFLLIGLLFFLFGLLGVAQPELSFALFLFGIPILVVAIAAGTIVYFVRGTRRAQNMTNLIDKAWAIASSPAMLATIALLALPLMSAGQYLANLCILAVHSEDYSEIVSRAERTRETASFSEYRGISYSVDPGPPVRVAFNPSGILDNWSAIVFDPTGEMLQADGFDAQTGEFRAPDRLTKLFGGDLVSCRRLWGDYLTCSFT